ncbi:signal transduction histidine kinase [Actinoplanes tereljensis]|uniref:histidine kinase n=1 Tax=Paractinoplanes tereljensis TaxID=571912 RepID=A0A919TYT6_9ACTN|nr:histidine kinase [Actinoplanes tereljensis]GIF26524.1 ATPase [Actinoplanes tereljensis]
MSPMNRVRGFLLVGAAGALDLLMWADDNGLRSGEIVPPWVVPVGSLATLATLLLRQRFPLPVFVVQLLWATACGIWFTEYTPVIGMLVAIDALAHHRSKLQSVSGWAACLLPYVLYAQGKNDGPWQVTFVFIFMLITGTAWILGDRSRLAEQLAAQRDAERAAASAEAVRTERLRIARELHDIVAHAVSVMVLQVAGARAVLTTDPVRAEAALDTVQDVGRQSMNELRRLLGLLRSASADLDVPATDQHLDLDGVDTLLANARAAGLTVDKQVSGTPGLLDPSVNLAAYRLVQESLTNALKHAGPGTVAQVALNWAPEQLTVTVQNDAPLPGKHPSGSALSTGHGLLGLRERVQTAGGTLHTGPSSTGFVVQAVLPTTVPLSAFGAAHERISS